MGVGWAGIPGRQGACGRVAGVEGETGRANTVEFQIGGATIPVGFGNCDKERNKIINISIRKDNEDESSR